MSMCWMRSSRPAESNPFLAVVHFVDHKTIGAEALAGLGLGHEVSRNHAMGKTSERASRGDRSDKVRA